MDNLSHARQLLAATGREDYMVPIGMTLAQQEQ
jgi:hypothetical protein